MPRFSVCIVPVMANPSGAAVATFVAVGGRALVRKFSHFGSRGVPDESTRP
jgi:hypothetical protein